MSAWHELVDRDQEIQNPTSPEKIRLAGDYLRLGPEDRVLDVACGMCGPAIVLAQAFGCRIHGVEASRVFADQGRRRIAAAGLEELIDVEVADAASADLGSYDVALCLGAAFVWGHIGDAARALAPVAPRIAIGEPFARAEGTEEEGLPDLPTAVARFESAGVDLIGLVAASEDDWDRYESLHWRAAVEAGVAGDDLETHRFRRDRHLRRRSALGWAIFVGRVRAS
ncbi:MAG TPA: methyltransferase domain-containing protein [Gaiellaceae bacterium]|nr:methyltransferase domain-containing protein [Gaiellaceae bacterium]